VEVGPDWGWNPLFDMICEMDKVLARIEKEGRARFGFTENDEHIDFARVGDDLIISSTYDPATATCSLGDFSRAYEKFARDALAQVMSEYPALQENAAVRALAARHGLLGRSAR
jgi:hypothetical protein